MWGECEGRKEDGGRKEGWCRKGDVGKRRTAKEGEGSKVGGKEGGRMQGKEEHASRKAERKGGGRKDGAGRGDLSNETEHDAQRPVKNAVTSKEHRGRALPLLPPLLPFSFAPVLPSFLLPLVLSFPSFGPFFRSLPSFLHPCL